ncbi:MAG: Cd2+/Zn2+-exporting [Planctomycetota bacterium]|nr:MAG: Cd2+/Zn2+-exporting [Planctomycetota bacterium]
MNAVLPLPALLDSRCGRCEGELVASLRTIPGVKEAHLQPDAEALAVEYDEASLSRERLAAEAQSVARVIAARAWHGTWYVSGMDCPGCGVGISKAVMRVPGVAWAEVDFGAGRLVADAERDAGPRVADEVRRLGYGVSDRPPGHGASSDPVAAPRLPRSAVLPPALAAAPLAAGFVLQWASLPRASAACFAGALVLCGLPALVRGLRMAWKSRSFDMFLLMSTACGGAAALGDWAEAGTAMFLFSVGTLLEALTFGKAREAIRALVELAPRDATVRREGLEIRVPVGELEPGMTVLVRPGERFAADGSVTAGESSVSEAFITGEAAPVEKAPGSPVYAGTLNGRGALEIRVTRAVADATVNRIVDLVERAQSRRAPSQRFVDRFARVYTPVVFLLAAGVAVIPPLALGAAWTPWLGRALTLLVVSCPCALILSTPVTILAAISSASRHGVLFKGGAALEALGRVRAIAFDKTGTLTEGSFEVTAVEAFGVTEAELLRRAAVAALAGEHPLSKAVVARAHGEEIRPESAKLYEALPGLGARVDIGGVEHLFGSLRLMRQLGFPPGAAEPAVARFEAEGRTCAILATRDGPVGVLAFTDRVRDHAASAIRELRAAGITNITMLTGDSEAAAQAASGSLGLDGIRAGLLPEDKLSAVAGLRARHGSLAMIGDGVNDAPALAAADAGIAMGAAGSDVALEAADVALMSADLRQLPFAVRLGRRATRVIAQNVALSLAFKLAFVVLASAGLANLWMAVVADVGVSLLVIFNGLRLLGTRDSAGGRREDGR